MTRTAWNRKYPQTWICKTCKCEFPNKTGHPREFCSKECFIAHQKTTDYAGRFENGEKHWNYNKSREATINRDNSRFNYPMMRAIAKKCNWKCAVCGTEFPDQPIYKIRRLMSFDHILAIKLGGEHNIDNGQLLCRPCNKHKTHEDIKRILKIKSSSASP